MEVVLALGGGGARGLSHLGILQVLEEEKIPIDGIVGASIGSIVGAGYAVEPDIRKLIQRAFDYLESPRFRNDMFRRMMFGNETGTQGFMRSALAAIGKTLRFQNLLRRDAIFEAERLRETVADLVGDEFFAETRIPFAVPAIDLRVPREVLIREGPLRRAVTASCSLAGFFPPVEMNGMLLADLGITGSVPVDGARAFAPDALVIAVDLSSQLQPIERLERGWDCILRVELMASAKLNQLALERADVVVRPEIGEKYWSDFSDLGRIVASGAAAARRVLPEIRAKLG